MTSKAPKSCASTPRCGLHALRIPVIDLAFWDVLGTVLAAILIWYVIRRWMPNLHVGTVIFIFFVIAIATHAYLGIDTRLNRFLFCGGSR